MQNRIILEKSEHFLLLKKDLFLLHFLPRKLQATVLEFLRAAQQLIKNRTFAKWRLLQRYVVD